MTFQYASSLYLAEQRRSEVELGPVPTRMSNGLWMSFANSTLEIRGVPSQENRFQFITVGVPFHVDIWPTTMVINGEICVTADNVTYGERLGEANGPEHVLTLFGPAQKMIQLMFKRRSYVLNFGDEGLGFLPLGR